MSEFKIKMVAALICLALGLVVLGGVVALGLATGTTLKVSSAAVAGVAVVAARRRQEEAKKARSRR